VVELGREVWLAVLRPENVAIPAPLLGEAAMTDAALASTTVAALDQTMRSIPIGHATTVGDATKDPVAVGAAQERPTPAAVNLA